MPRRIVTLYIDLDEELRPVEINRAWSQDEILMPNGSLGQTVQTHVDATTLAGLLPDTAATIAQLVRTQDERDAAVTAAEAAKADRDAAVAAAQQERDEAVTTAQEERDAAVSRANGERESFAAERANLTAQIEALKAPSATPRTYLSDVWRRASDDESAKIEAFILTLPARERNLLNASQYLAHDDPDFPRIVAAMTQMFGESRASVLLAASGV